MHETHHAHKKSLCQRINYSLFIPQSVTASSSWPLVLVFASVAVIKHPTKSNTEEGKLIWLTVPSGGQSFGGSQGINPGS